MMEFKSARRSHRKEAATRTRSCESGVPLVAEVHAFPETIGCGGSGGGRGSIFGGGALLLKFLEQEPTWTFLTSRVIRSLVLGMGTANKDKKASDCDRRHITGYSDFQTAFRLLFRGKAKLVASTNLLTPASYNQIIAGFPT